MTSDDVSREERIPEREALLRYTAALPPRDDSGRDAYREWAGLDAGSPGFAICGREPCLRDKTAGELRQLAEAGIKAHAERAARLRDHTIELQVPPWENEFEAGA